MTSNLVNVPWLISTSIYYLFHIYSITYKQFFVLVQHGTKRELLVVKQTLQPVIEASVRRKHDSDTHSRNVSHKDFWIISKRVDPN